MEENIKVEDVKVEVKEKKKISKKVLAIGGTILALGIGAVVLLMKGNDQEDNDNQVVDATYEEVSNNSEVEE